MRNKLTFAALAAAILLTGAVAAGTAAQRVVAPKTGEVWSAGEVSVPTVFGQTAEEVLFYPWSLYDTQTLYPLPTEELLSMYGFGGPASMPALTGYYVTDPASDGSWLDSVELSAAAGIDLGETETEAASGRYVLYLPEGKYVLYPAENDTDVTYQYVALLEDSFFGTLARNFALIRPTELNLSEILAALAWNVPPGRDETDVRSVLMYLKDFPTRIYPSGMEDPSVGVTLNFAFSDGDSSAMSFLIRPQEARELTGEEQDQAMEKVDGELRQLFLSPNIVDTELGVLLQNFMSCNDLSIWGCTGLRTVLLQNLFDGYGRSTDSEGRWYEDVSWPEELLDEDLPLDDFLSGIEAMGTLTVQLVNTQSQIVVLLTFESGEVLGAYYDIQLGCWSGMGYME